MEFGGTELVRQLRTSLSGLTRTQRAVFVLISTFGFSVRDVAQALGLGEETVRALLREARGEVKEVRESLFGRSCPGPSVVGRFVERHSRRDDAGLAELMTSDVTLWVLGDAEVIAPAPVGEGPRVVAELLVERVPGTLSEPVVAGGASCVLTAADPACTVILDVDPRGELISELWLVVLSERRHGE